MENDNEQDNRKVISVSPADFRKAAEQGLFPNYTALSVLAKEKIEELRATLGYSSSPPSVVDEGRAPSWLRK